MPIDKREQVFVSSTYLDLKAERQEVIQTLLEANCIPAGMELFPASDDDKWTLIKRVIDDSDYYVVVIGGRYGSIDPERGISFTEMEFDYAVETKKPVMAFLHGEPGKIPGEKLELEEEPRKKLDAFRAKCETRVVKYWTTPAELGGQVAKSLIQTRNTHPAEGWVRASAAMTPETEREIAELRARVAELTNDLEHARQIDAEVPLDIAQGDDPYDFATYLHYYTKDQVAKGYRYSDSRSHLYEIKTTWNGIFSRLAPHMLDEASEKDLDKELDDMARDLLVDHLDADGELPDDYAKEDRTEAAASVIQDVKVQFFALNLIAQSDRRRAVTDKNTYWTLTQAGRAQMMRLRAIRRKTGDTPAADRSGE